jgi:hypothetical protein
MLLVNYNPAWQPVLAHLQLTSNRIIGCMHWHKAQVPRNYARCTKGLISIAWCNLIHLMGNPLVLQKSL